IFSTINNLICLFSVLGDENVTRTRLRNLPTYFVKPIKNPPKWERQLMLPSEPFPNYPQEYTRYRLQIRHPHDVFLDRVADQLRILWSKRRCRNFDR
ncbi:hypothetical protein FGIG_02422, partial [Fasciola gigantica]